MNGDGIRLLSIGRRLFGYGILILAASGVLILLLLLSVFDVRGQEPERGPTPLASTPAGGRSTPHVLFAYSQETRPERGVTVLPASREQNTVPQHNPVTKADTDIWTRVGDAGGVPVHALALGSSSAGQIYAGTYYRGLFISPDGGASWSNPHRASVGAIAVDTNIASVLYAGTWHAGALKSTNGGADWLPIDTALAANDVYAVAIDPTSPNTVYAGTEMGIFKSTDGGANWQAASSGFTGRNVYALTFVRGTLLAGTDMGAFTSGDDGVVWTAANTGLYANQVYALACTSKGAVYAGTDRGVFLSTDGGSIWTKASRGLGSGELDVYALAVNAADAEAVYAGTPVGFYATWNGGAYWWSINSGLDGYALYIAALTADPTTEPVTVYAGTGRGVWKIALATVPRHMAYLPVVMREP